MAQPDIPNGSSLKGKEIDIGEVNGAEQTQCNASYESWLIQIESTLDSPDMWQVSKKVCIYRVPKPLMISKPQGYAPLVVSFGPFHQNFNAEFSRMNQHKLEAVRRMLTRLPKDVATVATLIAEIQKFEYEIRECYEEQINLDGKALSSMLAMDACFILEFFRCIDPDCFSLIFQQANTVSNAIRNDILKLENQIPLFLLVALLQLECKSRELATRKLADLLIKYNAFRGFPFSVSQDDNTSLSVEELKKYIEKEPPPCHLLDLSRMVINDLLIKNLSVESGTPVESDGSCSNNDHGWFGRSMNVNPPDWMQPLLVFSRPPKTHSPNEMTIPRAHLLHQAGIEFKVGRLDFEKTVFEKVLFGFLESSLRTTQKHCCKT